VASRRVYVRARDPDGSVGPLGSRRARGFVERLLASKRSARELGTTAGFDSAAVAGARNCPIAGREDATHTRARRAGAYVTVGAASATAPSRSRDGTGKFLTVPGTPARALAPNRGHRIGPTDAAASPHWSLARSADRAKSGLTVA
jgi:hypothetical protein